MLSFQEPGRSKSLLSWRGVEKLKNYLQYAPTKRCIHLPTALQWGKIQAYWKGGAPTDFTLNFSYKRHLILTCLVPLSIWCSYSKCRLKSASRDCSWPRLPPPQTSGCPSSPPDHHPARQHIQAVLHPSSFKPKAGLLRLLRLIRIEFFNVNSGHFERTRLGSKCMCSWACRFGWRASCPEGHANTAGRPR